MTLKRLFRGAYASDDGRWRFARHESDPVPKRWFAYVDGNDYPANEGAGHVRLADAVEWAERYKK